MDNLLYDGDNKKTDSMEAFPSAEHYQVKKLKKSYDYRYDDRDGVSWIFRLMVQTSDLAWPS